MAFIHPDWPKLAPRPDMLERLNAAGVTIRNADRLGDVIGDLDMIYMTRIQHEHDNEADQEFFEKRFVPGHYQLTGEMLGRMREYCAILHPFPRNQEIPFEVDTDPRAMYFRQARNGMWIRAALLAHIFDADGKIASYYLKHYGRSPESGLI